MNMKKYTITCTEEQLRLIADAVEDWTRFLCGQCELDHATFLIEPLNNFEEVRKILHDQVHPLVTPDLPLNASYGWSGGNCPNDYQKRAIAMGYGIYRQILHHLAIENNLDNCYTFPTLTCPEQGNLITIETKN